LRRRRKEVLVPVRAESREKGERGEEERKKIED